MVAIFPKLCFWQRSLRSNLGGIDPEKLYRATLMALLSGLRKNDFTLLLTRGKMQVERPKSKMLYDAEIYDDHFMGLENRYFKYHL